MLPNIRYAFKYKLHMDKEIFMEESISMKMDIVHFIAP